MSHTGRSGNKAGETLLRPQPPSAAPTPVTIPLRSKVLRSKRPPEYAYCNADCGASCRFSLRVVSLLIAPLTFGPQNLVEGGPSEFFTWYRQRPRGPASPRRP